MKYFPCYTRWQGSHDDFSQFVAVSVLSDGTIVLTGTTTRDCEEGSSKCNIEIVFLDDDGGELGSDRVRYKADTSGTPL